MKKLMMWLGLGPDDAYDDLSEEPLLRGPLSSTEFVEARAAAEDDGTARPILTPVEAPVEQSRTVRMLPAEPTGTVRPLKPATAARPSTVMPGSFNDVQEMADRFKAGQPVIVNLQGVDAELSRRIIDFASGVCYGAEGQMERVTNQVYLLTPSDVEVSDEDRRRFVD